MERERELGWMRPNECKNETGTGAGTCQERERERERRWRPVNEHKMGTGTGAGTETRAVADMGTGTRMTTGTETRMGLGRTEERRRRAIHRTRVVDAIREMGRKRKQKRVGSVSAHTNNLKNSKEAEGGAQGTQRLRKNCISRESVPSLSRLIRGFRREYI